MSYQTVNPATGETGATFADITDAESLLKVRAHKQAMKARARAKA